MSAYLRMMPVLLAEESQRMAERLAVGTGSASVESRRAIEWKWRQEANLEGGAKPAPLPLQRAVDFGIGVTVVPPKAKA